MTPRNAFWVLGVSPEATPADVEREGRKILGLFGVGAKSASSYTCPLGTFRRDETMVREAMTALRDPKRRARERCLARLLDGASDRVVEPDAPLPNAFSIGGFRGL